MGTVRKMDYSKMKEVVEIINCYFNFKKFRFKQCVSELNEMQSRVEAELNQFHADLNRFEQEYAQLIAKAKRSQSLMSSCCLDHKTDGKENNSLTSNGIQKLKCSVSDSQLGVLDRHRKKDQFLSEFVEVKERVEARRQKRREQIQLAEQKIIELEKTLQGRQGNFTDCELREIALLSGIEVKTLKGELLNVV